MKRSLSIVLASVMLFSTALSGCGSTAPKPTATPAPASTAAPAPAATGAPAPAATNAPAATPATPAGTEQVAYWNLGADPKTLDPTLNSATDGSNVITNIFEGLYRNKGNGPEPAIAESHTVSADGLTYTFKLRDAMWSDGVPVKAKDFVFSWRRAVNPNTVSEYGYIFFPIKNADLINQSKPNPDGTFSDKDGKVLVDKDGKNITIESLGVEAPDDKTLIVHLERPAGMFLELIYFPTYSPLREDIVGKDIDGAWAKDPTKIISNGPFKLTEYVAADHLTLSKNDKYWNVKNVKLDKVVAKMISDPSTVLTGYKAGDIYYSEVIPLDEITSLIRSGDVQLMDYIGLYFYVINEKYVQLKDPKVRRALSEMIDREGVTKALGGGQIPAKGVVPPGFTTPDGKDFRDVAGDYGLSTTPQTEKALKLFQEAGFTVKDGKVQGLQPFELLISNNTPNHKIIAEIIQNNWASIGVKAEIVAQEWAVCQVTRRDLQYKGIARHGWIGDYLDPQTFLDMFMTGNVQSGSGYANKDYDAAVNKAMKSTGKDRYDAWLEAEKIIMGDNSILPIYYYTLPVLSSEKFQGWYLSPMGKLWLGDAYIQ